MQKNKRILVEKQIEQFMNFIESNIKSKNVKKGR